MIKIDEVTISEFRGIRSATLPLRRMNTVVSGPNGTGKSGVVDAIQFVLTGDVARLTGEGSKGLTLAEHGPHVLVRDEPSESWVSMKVYIPHLDRSAVITRTVKKPSKPKIEPNSPDIVEVFTFLESHAELSLSRREVIKFILSEDGKRSTNVQALLRLEAIDQARAALKTARNKLEKANAQSEAVANADEQRLVEHFKASVNDDAELLTHINARRVVLGLLPLKGIFRGVAVTEGISEKDRAGAAGPSREAILDDLASSRSQVQRRPGDRSDKAVSQLLNGFRQLEEDPRLLVGMKRLGLLELGHDLVDSDECPLCETDWNADALREQLKRRIGESRAAKLLRDELIAHASDLAREATHLAARIATVASIPETVIDERILLQTWSADLLAFARGLSGFDELFAQRKRIQDGWVCAPSAGDQALSRLQTDVAGRPEDSEAGAARDFLVVAQERFQSYWKSSTDHSERLAAFRRGEEAHLAFVAVSENELTALYAEVEDEFASFYRTLNSEDESDFAAKMTPDDASLTLEVDFYRQGMFPPGAYHSEGHQDGMGVCLYLALAKQSLGEHLTLVVPDDVVMSVDSGHRRKFCQLLKRSFPKTQFIITTHDEMWARQLRSSGVVDSRGTFSFHSWDVEHGPLFEDAHDVWDRIDVDLKRNDVAAAAAKLRRHLEFVSSEIADLIAAPVRYRADAAYDLGDLLDAVISQQNKLIKAALDAAKSWGDDAVSAKIIEAQQARRVILEQRSDEQWLLNKAIHHNEWANVVREDFLPVRDAFRALFEAWRCVKCDSWLALSARVNPADLRCECGMQRFNLRGK
jgi:hypothetical protein